MALSEIRIIYVVGNLHLGGAQKLVAWLASGLSDRPGFSCSVCCLGEGGAYRDQLERRGYKVHVLGYKKQPTLKGFATAYRVIRDLRALFKQERVDIVHTYLFYTGILGRIAARSVGVPIIVHSFFRVQYRLQWLTERIMRRITRQYVVDSFAVRDSVVSQGGIKASETRVIYNGIDFDDLDSEEVGDLRRDLDLEGAAHVIGIVAHLSPGKGHSPFLKAFSRVLQTFPETWLLLVGDGPLRDQLETESEELGIKGRVLFLGFRSDLVSILNTIDLLVLSSAWEGFGIVQAEAMYFRVPVVGTNHGGTREVVRAFETGFLVPYGDVEQLADATRLLLGNDELRAEMGHAGRARVLRKFGRKRMLDQYEELYRGLIAETNVAG